jgi:hypothetical protein
MNALHEVREVFDNRNMFLQVAMGLVSSSLGFERLLREQASFAPAPSAHEDDPALDFVLGLVAFTQRILAHAEIAVAQQEHGAGADSIVDVGVASAHIPPLRRGLLR